MTKIGIYLGGSEKGSYWRTLLVPFLPNTDFIESERNDAAANILTVTNTAAIDKCLVHLHGVTPVDYGLHVAAELMRSVSTNPKGTILFIRTEEKGFVFPDEIKRELYILADYVNQAGGVTILNDISETVSVVNEMIDIKESFIKSNKTSEIRNVVDTAYTTINTKLPDCVLGGKPKEYSLVNALSYFLSLANERSSS